MKVQGIKAKVNYNVHLEFDASQELMDTVRTPVFRMELFRPQSPKRINRPVSDAEAKSANKN